MSSLVGTILVLSCVYNNSLFISRPDIGVVGEEAFLCSSYDYQRLPCAWPTEWKRLLVKTVNSTNIFVVDNITGIHFSKIRYVLKAKQYVESQWISVMNTEATMTTTTSNDIFCIISVLILTLSLFIYGGYIVYKRKHNRNNY